MWRAEASDGLQSQNLNCSADEPTQIFFQQVRSVFPLKIKNAFFDF